jgi:hypothetical protein
MNIFTYLLGEQKHLEKLDEEELPFQYHQIQQD